MDAKARQANTTAAPDQLSDRERLQDAEIVSALYDLGSRSEQIRASGRAAILSYGDQALTVILREMDAWREERRATARKAIIPGAVAFVFLYLLLRRYGHKEALLEVYLVFTACAFVLGFLSRPPRWFRESVQLIDHFEGPEVTMAMLNAFQAGDGRQESLRSAIIRRLSQVTADDATWLSGAYRAQVIRWLPFDGWTGRQAVDDKLTIARALVAIGATEALPDLKILHAPGPLPHGHRDRLTQGIQKAVRELEALAEKRRPSETLLRPAETAADQLLHVITTPGGATPDALLRPASRE